MLKWIVYNAIFSLAYPFLLPGFLLRMFKRGGYAARMGDRFALYPQDVIDEFRRADGWVWIHAVSVGEVQVAGQLMREWRKVEPTVRFCFSTTSSTGWKMAKNEVSDKDRLIYNPIDFHNFVKSALKTVKPRAVVLTESEIWPNFIRTAHRMRIPLFLINARVSDRSAPRYRMARWWFGEIFLCFTRIFAQSDLDRDRIVEAGAPSETVEVTGSFKFDVAHRNEAKERELREWIGEGKLLLGGSTWPGEDEVMLKIFVSLKSRMPSLKLVIAPRHFEKADEIESNIRKFGFNCVRRSRGDHGEGVYLADTTGELMGLYGISDAVFVGKSLCAHGSQNMIEPCLCGKPTYVGPYTENFRPVMSDLLSANAIVQVKDASELETAIAKGLENPGDLGNRAMRAVKNRRGVVAKCVAAIKGSLCLLAVCLFFGCSKEAKLEIPQSGHVFEPIRIVSVYISMMEKPDAARVLLIGDEAKRLGAYFERVGVNQCTTVDGRYDLIVVSCGEMTKASCRKATELLSQNGVMVWLMDVRGASSAKFKQMIESFDFAETHLWMPGEEYWLMAGRSVPRKIKLSAMLDVFAREGAFADMAKAGCGTLPELFANYVGRKEDVLPAFSSGDHSDSVRPEFFLTKDVPKIEWIAPDGVDADILSQVRSEIRSMQVVRREVVEGNMISRTAKDNKSMGDATEKWGKAALRNPNDLFILERLDRLDRNARGFIEVGKLLQAMKCYETMVLIKPNDANAVHNFGMCLKKIGKLDLAEKILKRAEALANQKAEQ